MFYGNIQLLMFEITDMNLLIKLLAIR